MNLVPPRREQGMPGACRTRGLVCKKCERMRTRAYRYSRSTPAFPAQGSQLARKAKIDQRHVVDVFTFVSRFTQACPCDPWRTSNQPTHPPGVVSERLSSSLHARRPSTFSVFRGRRNLLPCWATSSMSVTSISKLNASVATRIKRWR